MNAFNDPNELNDLNGQSQINQNCFEILIDPLQKQVKNGME